VKAWREIWRLKLLVYSTHICKVAYPCNFFYWMLLVLVLIALDCAELNIYQTKISGFFFFGGRILHFRKGISGSVLKDLVYSKFQWPVCLSESIQHTAPLWLLVTSVPFISVLIIYIHTYIHTYIHAFLLTDLDIFLNRIYGAVKTIAISINIEDTNQLACIKQAV